MYGEVASKLVDQFRISQTFDLGMYFDMPLLHKRVGQGTYNFLVEKLKKKLRAWKGHSMSMASRALLVQTTSSIANYAMKRL